MMAVYQFCADVVVVLHFAYALFIIFGLLAVLMGGYLGWRWVRNFWFRVVHLSMILIVAVQSLFCIACPLTTFENYLRRKADIAGYERSFIGHWVHELLFFDAPDWVFTVVYCLFGALVVLTMYLVPPAMGQHE